MNEIEYIHQIFHSYQQIVEKQINSIDVHYNDDNSVFNKFNAYELPSTGVVIPPIAIEYIDEHVSDIIIFDKDALITVDELL